MTPRAAAALILALAALAAPGPLLASAGTTGTTPVGHPSWTVESCLACHCAEETADLSERVARPCRALCATCHGLRDGHHPVDVPISRTPSAPLVLTAAGTNTCVTCHDTNQPRVDRKPWESQSLVRRLARKTTEHRTRYLAFRNDKGQLCRACH
jgi:hypothetical protein